MVLAAVAGRAVGHGVLEAARGALDAHDRDGDARLERGRAEGRVEAVDLLLLGRPDQELERELSRYEASILVSCDTSVVSSIDSFKGLKTSFEPLGFFRAGSSQEGGMLPGWGPRRYCAPNPAAVATLGPNRPR